MTSNASEVVNYSDFSFAQMFLSEKALAIEGFLLKTQERNLLPVFASWCCWQDAVLGVVWGAGWNICAPFNPPEMERTSMICCRTASTPETGDFFFPIHCFHKHLTGMLRWNMALNWNGLSSFWSWWRRFFLHKKSYEFGEVRGVRGILVVLSTIYKEAFHMKGPCLMGWRAHDLAGSAGNHPALLHACWLSDFCAQSFH